MEKLNFFVVGGDERNIELARLLIQDGHNVSTYGFEKSDVNVPMSKNFSQGISDADVIVSGLPMSKDNKTLNAPFSSEEILLEDILNLLTQEQIFTAGKIEKEILDRKKQAYIEDYFSREELQVLNAIPTAEGAIQIAMEEMKITLHGSKAMVLGYGRIGKALSKMLQGIGANVYVEARSAQDLAWIKNNGYTSVPLKELHGSIGTMDVVFNTIPELILDESLLGKLNKNCIVIDLASKPGGVDREVAKELNVKVISAIGLPGKVAPVSAANAIKDTIYHIIDEGRVRICR